MTDNRYGGFHLCGECGKEIKNGKFCKHEIPKIRAEDRVMKPEWMLTDEEIIELIEQLEELEPQSSLSKWIAKHQAKKLLEYLKSKTILETGWIGTNEFISMLKELEASQ